MVAILNYLPYLVVLVGVGLWFYWSTKNKLTLKRSAYILVGTFIIVTMLNALTPSYMPKGQVRGLENPAFSESNATVEDRLLKPEQTNEERKTTFDEKFDALKK